MTHLFSYPKSVCAADMEDVFGDPDEPTTTDCDDCIPIIVDSRLPCDWRPNDKGEKAPVTNEERLKELLGFICLVIILAAMGVF